MLRVLSEVPNHGQEEGYKSLKRSMGFRRDLLMRQEDIFQKVEMGEYVY